MGSTTRHGSLASVWRLAKVVFAAWAFAVACVIVIVLALLVAAPSAEAWVGDNVLLVFFAFFVVGVPVMFRWLR
jgi:hypothetical protein